MSDSCQTTGKQSHIKYFTLIILHIKINYRVKYLSYTIYSDNLSVNKFVKQLVNNAIDILFPPLIDL